MTEPTVTSAPCSRPGVSGSEPRPGGRSPDLSLNWTLGAGGPEELSTSSGQMSGGGGASRLCRRSLFARWRRLQQQVRGGGVDSLLVTVETAGMFPPERPERQDVTTLAQ